MARTNIEIDDETVARVMERYHLPTKRAAVDFALRKVAGPRITLPEFEAAYGLWGHENGSTPESPVDGWDDAPDTSR